MERCQKSLVLTFFITLRLFSTTSGQSLESTPILTEGYYVTLGAFAFRRNATNFNAQLLAAKLNSAWAFFPKQNLYFVYLTNNSDPVSCLAEAASMRHNPKFADAWVKWVPPTSGIEKPVDDPSENDLNEPTHSNSSLNSLQLDTMAAKNKPALVTVDREYFLSLYDEGSNRVAEGKIKVVDTERGELLSVVEGNRYLTLPQPKGKSGMLSLICEASGYRKVQRDIYWREPLSDSTESFINDMGTCYAINFALVRYQKGDIYALYSVYFYNDAAIFLPESKFELNELLVMMKENPQLKIRLHGHTNGSYFGKIIKFTSIENAFRLSDDAKVSMGSSKELSEERAMAIKRFLASNGVDESRIEVKAWGGKRPLHDKNGANARRNIRVEVEILED